MNHSVKKISALATILILVLAWLGGERRARGAVEDQIHAMIPGLTFLEKKDDRLYQGRWPKASSPPVTIAIESCPGYAGPLTVALAVGPENKVNRVAILHSTDTPTFLDKIVDKGLLKAFIHQPINPVPQVDGISGATLSSVAVIQGLTQAGQRIHGLASGEKIIPASIPVNRNEWIKLLGIAALFSAALGLGLIKAFKTRKKARTLLSIVSLVLVGVIWGCQFSLPSLALALSGVWVQGLASWAPLLCMVLALMVFWRTQKNIYCAFFCPFGMVQDGLGKITGCPPPKRFSWMTWTARSLALFALASALYFKDSSMALYEPFGMVFNFIGSPFIFGLTIAILLTSLIFRRPWCRLLCRGRSKFCVS
ncbi:MAG: FMN-binding protein [Desulfobacter sp.]|nr:MAG: FMN-binding protein [Desulfobacter sp.]